jgi:hypothetical protein
VSEFLADSVETLERLANPKAPPLELTKIEKLALRVLFPKANDDLKDDVEKMEEAFLERGDLIGWPDDVLNKIDQCFVNNFFTSGVAWNKLFCPDVTEGYNRFLKYQSDVDKVLEDNSATVPPYAREYFAYSMIWSKRGYRFPIPLGTKSVIGLIHALTKKHSIGLTEVCV